MQIETIPCHTHEKVLSWHDPGSGLRAIIAIHDTTLGPALGGCRMWHYPRRQDALADALRLSKGMTAKSALAGVPFGGGKAVILANPQTEKTHPRLIAFGRFVERLGGEYITGEDVGTSPADMAVIASETSHVVGLSTGTFASGDPSPVTADHVFRCMKIAARHRFGSNDLHGIRVAVQGLGHVGLPLVERLCAAGALVVAADPNDHVAARAADRYGVQIVPPGAILEATVEILAPCALGGVFSDSVIGGLKAQLICGSANNQLPNRGSAQKLHDRGILYCPDYVVNSGGLINAAQESLKFKDPDWVRQKLVDAERSFEALLVEARRTQQSPLPVADKMVESILQANRNGPGDNRASGS